MRSLDLDYTVATRPDDDTEILSLSSDDLAKFNSSLLGLGTIAHEGEYLEALAAIFDLQGFTDFCNQIDPHLVVPEFLDAFLAWLFSALASEVTITADEDEDKVYVWTRLPFFAKFLGDGILFLWNTRGANAPEELGNVIIALHNLCTKYGSEFLPSVRSAFVRAPQALRCGIARGQVISIGGGADYVGSCINMAARLQKLGKLTFAFPRRGFPPDRCFTQATAREFVARRARIRGIGDNELVMILQDEFTALTPTEQAEFPEP